jgi:hypothetical protein
LDLPRANGNTTSAVSIETLMGELAAAHSPDQFLEVKAFPASDVPARIDRFLDELRDQPVAIPEPS